MTSTMPTVKKNVNVIYLPMKDQRALGARSKASVHSRSEKKGKNEST